MASVDQESLLCPVCTELPEAEVYQCFNGHVLCKACFSQVTKCPQCRVQLSRSQPIRCRFFEDQLGKLKLECPFKSNGCRVEPPRKAYQNHQTSCCYDFKKFGNFVNICELLGHQNCSFLVNNGNTMEAVTHLVAVHGITCRMLVEDLQTVRMKHTDFNNCAESEGLRACKPLIVDLPSKLCYVLVTLVTNHEDFDLWAVYLPYSNNPSLSKSPVQMDYSLFAGKSSRPWKLTFSDLPVTLEDAVKLKIFKPTGIASPLRLKKTQFSAQFSEKDGCLVMDLSFGPDTISYKAHARSHVQQVICKCTNEAVSQIDSINDQEAPVAAATNVVEEVVEPLDVADLEKGDVVWHPIIENKAACRVLNHQENLYKEGETLLLPIFGNVFASKSHQQCYPKMKYKSPLDYLRSGCLFKAAMFGHAEALKYVIAKKLNLNVVNAKTGETPLHWTMLDCNKERGLAKAKVLIENGADVKALSNQNWSLLHYAVMYSDKEAVEYFVGKGVNVNGMTLKGYTPLDLAMQYRSEDDGAGIIMILRNQGIDRKLRKRQETAV